jgi:hypothetical protein
MDKATRELFSPKGEKSHQKTHKRDAVKKVRNLFANTSGPGRG